MKEMEFIRAYHEEIERECIFCGSTNILILEVYIKQKNKKFIVRMFFSCVDCEELFFLDIKED
jgi:hypothetical protein